MEARKEGLSVAASSSGGKLAEWAERDGVPFARIAFTDMQPRHTLAAAFTGIYAMLRNSGLADDVTEDIKRVAEVMKESSASLESIGKSLAEDINGTVPVYLSSDMLGFAAKNFKIQTNENAKYPAFWNVFPELNHNELVGFSKLNELSGSNKFTAVFLDNENDHPRVKARMKVTKELYSNWGANVQEISVEGKTLLEKIFYGVTVGLWTTNYLALANDIDPVPVDGVENFKTSLVAEVGEIDTGKS